MTEATEGLLEEGAVLGGECPLPPGALLVGVTMISSLGDAWLRRWCVNFGSTRFSHGNFRTIGSTHSFLLITFTCHHRSDLFKAPHVFAGRVSSMHSPTLCGR